jgi:uncharacterized protein (DUF1330 family)
MTHKPHFVNWSLHLVASHCLFWLTESLMPQAYWIARVDVIDAEKYKAYAAASFQQYGAKYLVRGGPCTAAEGQARSRNVVIEFPTYQAALDCYHSEDYHAARAHRLPAATGEIVIVEGVEP